MKRPASVRFADVLAASGRDDVTRAVASAGAALTSWGDAANRTYARVSVPDAAALERVAALLPDASVASPPHAVLRVVPARPGRLDALARTLNAVSGAVAIDADATSLTIELDLSALPLASVVGLVDVALRGEGWRIEPVLPLEDDALVRFAATLLGDPGLDVSRLIETHLAPLLERDVA